MMRKTVWLLVLFSAFSALRSSVLFSAEVYIPVGDAKIKRSIFAFPETTVQDSNLSSTLKNFLTTVRDTINHNLDFTNLFNFQSANAFIEKPGAGITIETFKLTDWSTIGTEFLLKTLLTPGSTPETVNLEVRLFDVLGKRQALVKKYVAKVSEPKILGGTVSNEIVEALTGKRGIFFTKLLMVCDKTGNKEIWMADFDGSNPKQLTAHRSIAFSPAWSLDGKKMLYSLYTKNAKNIKNIDLYEFNFATKKARLISNRKGINSGAAYHPDNNRIVLTMSFLGNPEIFLLNPNNNQATKLVSSLGVDVDPIYSPNGKKLAFVSSRSSQAMVYVANADGSNVDRVTFAGQYNATPRWHPTGAKLTFAGFLEKHFDLFVINADKTNLERLTKNEGNNEDPDFSPDGNYITFSSNRTGQKNIYVISMDGLNTRRLTYGLGNCVAPRWSPYEDNR